MQDVLSRTPAHLCMCTMCAPFPIDNMSIRLSPPGAHPHKPQPRGLLACPCSQIGQLAAATAPRGGDSSPVHMPRAASCAAYAIHTMFVPIHTRISAMHAYAGQHHAAAARAASARGCVQAQAALARAAYACWAPRPQLCGQLLLLRLLRWQQLQQLMRRRQFCEAAAAAAWTCARGHVPRHHHRPHHHHYRHRQCDQPSSRGGRIGLAGPASPPLPSPLPPSP